MDSKSPRKKRGVPPPQNQALSDQVKAGLLPADVLHIIFGHLKPMEVVNAGQVCHGWRVAAKDVVVWRDVSLDYMPPEHEKQDQYGNLILHSYAKEFSRILRFASALKSLKVVGPVKSGTRPAMKASKLLQLREVCFDGSKEYLVKFAVQHKAGLLAAAFWNATHSAARAAAELANLESLSLCYPRLSDRDSGMFFFPYRPTPKAAGAAGPSTSKAGKAPKVPPGPHAFLAEDLPRLRRLQLLRVPDASARSLLQLRGPGLDSLDVDVLSAALPLLHTCARLQRLVLRCEGPGDQPQLQARLQQALPRLTRLREVVLLRDRKRAAHDHFGGCSFPCCSAEACDNQDCECADLRAIAASVQCPLVSVCCTDCDWDSPPAEALAEEDMEKFVYTGPRNAPKNKFAGK